MSNFGNFVRFKGPKVLEKRYFTMKERSHKNSLVLTRKLAPKEEEWNSLQRAVNFQTSWNFVFKKYLHCCTLDSILIYEKERVWNCLCTHYFHFLQLCLLFNLNWSLFLHPNHHVDHPLFDQELHCSTMDSILKWKGIFIKFIMQLSLLFNLTWSFISLLLPQCIQITM